MLVHAVRDIRMNKYVVTFVVACFLFVPLTYAEEQQPWTHPDVLRAAMSIGLANEQQPIFRSAVGSFLQNFFSDVHKLMKAHNQSGLKRKISSKRRARVDAMNEQINGILTDEQQPAYEKYRELLLQKMDERAASIRR